MGSRTTEQAISRKTIAIEIANQSVTLELDSRLVAELRPKWGGFFVDPEQCQNRFAHFSVEELPSPADIKKIGGPPTVVQAFEQMLIVVEDVIELRLCKADRKGEIRYRRLPQDDILDLGPGGLRATLVALWAATLPSRGGFLLHASGIDLDGRGVAFFGRSGAGKSTVCSMFPPGTVLNDELVAITEGDDELRVHSTPFSGSLEQARTRRWAPLAGLFELHQASTTAAERLRFKAGIAPLLRCAAISAGAPSIERQVFLLGLNTALRIPLFRLFFPLDAAAVQAEVAAAIDA